MCALIQFGSIVTGITGKLGGHVYGNSQNGGTIRNKPATKKLWGYIKRGASGGGQSPQTNVSVISQAWKDLDDTERAAWSAYAVQYYTTRNLYGTHSLSGYTCFSKLNHNILLCGLPLITVPVPKVSLTDPGTCNFSTLSTSVVKIAYSNSLNPDEYFLVSATGTNTVTLIAQKKGFKIMGAYSSSVASPLDISTVYTQLKGAPLSGGWVTGKIEVINGVTGQRGMARSFTHVVA